MNSIQTTYLGMTSHDFSPQTTLDHLAETVEQYGVAVLPNVFTEQECDSFRKIIFDHLETKLNVKDADDFIKLKRIGEGKGIIRNYGLPLIKPVLDLKTDQRVIDAYSRLWPEANGELTTSLDALHIGAPPEITKERHFFNKTAFHTDQGDHKPGKFCIQVNVLDSFSGLN